MLLDVHCQHQLSEMEFLSVFSPVHEVMSGLRVKLCVEFFVIEVHKYASTFHRCFFDNFLTDLHAQLKHGSEENNILQDFCAFMYSRT